MTGAVLLAVGDGTDLIGGGTTKAFIYPHADGSFWTKFNGVEAALLGVPASRTVTGTGLLAGGGDLSTNRTITVAAAAANTILANNTGGSAVPTFISPSALKTLLSIANTDISGLGTLSTQSGTFSGTHSGSSSGTNTGDQTITLTGDITGSGTGSFVTAIAANIVANADLVQMPTMTLKGNNTGGTANAADLTVPQVQLMLNSLTGWLDVSIQASPVLPGNSATTNTSNNNAILAAASNGTTIYYPHQSAAYQFNGAWNLNNKMFTFQGQGSNRAGSPATAFTELRWVANVGGDLIPLPGSGNGWYTQFRDLTFTAATVDQASGAVINVNGNVGTNIQNCSFQSAGTFFNDVLVGSGGNGSNSWNSAIISNCNIQGFKGLGVRCNSSGSSLVIENTVIQGNWGGFTGTPASNSALACVSGGFVGALQLIGCDLLGAVNNILLNPVLASSEVCASVFVNNTYLDNSAGSCFKVTGTGATVRVSFDMCSFTTAGTNYSSGGTGLSAIEIGGSFVFAAGGQNITFNACNIYNTFGTVGTTNGILINGTWADIYFTDCKVSGWTNGYNVTPSGTNISNLKINGGACGPSGGYGLNTTGFNIAAGSYKGLQIQQCNAHGNTTNLTLGAVTVAGTDASLFRISDNTGINPRGSVTTPGFPAASTTVTNTTGFRVIAYVKWAATAPTAVTINGVASQLPPAAINVYPIQLDPGGTFSFTGTAASGWTWIAN